MVCKYSRRKYTARFRWERATSPTGQPQIGVCYLHFHKPCALHNWEPDSPPPQHNNVVHSSVPDPRWGEDRAKERGRRDDIHEDVCGGMGGTSLQRNLFVASASMVMGEEEQVHRSSRDTSVHAQSPGRDEPHPLQPEDHSPPRSPLLAACSPRPRGGSLGLSVSAEAASPRV